jgi:hypothetical protein
MGPQPLQVWTFGGASLADLTRLRRVAQRMVAAHRAGHQLVTVLSAMGSSTDELTAMAYAMSTRPQLRELDALLWSGCSKEGITKSHLYVSDTRHFRGEVSPGAPWHRNPPRIYAGPRPASTRRRAEVFHHRPVTLLLTQGPR